MVAHGGRCIDFSAIGSLGDAVRAVTLANRAVIAANDGKVKTWFHGRTVRRPTVKYALRGLLAGLGAALGFPRATQGAHDRKRLSTDSRRAKVAPWIRFADIPAAIVADPRERPHVL